MSSTGGFSGNPNTANSGVFFEGKSLVLAIPQKYIPQNYFPGNCSVAKHSVAPHFPGFGGVSQENHATHSEKGPVAPTFSALNGGVALEVASWRVSRYRGCCSYTVACRAAVRHLACKGLRLCHGCAHFWAFLLLHSFGRIRLHIMYVRDASCWRFSLHKRCQKYFFSRLKTTSCESHDVM